MNYSQLGDYRSSLMSTCNIDKSGFLGERTHSMLSSYNTDSLGLNSQQKNEKEACRSNQEGNSQMKNVKSESDGKDYGNENVNYNSEQNEKSYESLNQEKIRSNNNNTTTNHNYQDEKLKNRSQNNIFENKDKCNDVAVVPQLENVDNSNENSYKNSHLEINSTDTNMMGNTTETNNYPRDNDLRYTNLNDSRSTSYTNDSSTNRNVEYEVQMVHSTSHRPYDPGTGLVNSQQTAFERYDSNYPSQRQNLYTSYGQSSIGDINSQSKYLLESQNLNSAMKIEHEDNTGPIYPRPLYQYDPIATSIPSGFSAMNLSVKISSSQLSSYKTSSSSPSPTSTTTTAATGNSNVPIIDLSTNGITSTSSNGFGPISFGSNSRKSPSGNEPTPGQTLDLSVNRIR